MARRLIDNTLCLFAVVLDACATISVAIPFKKDTSVLLLSSLLLLALTMSSKKEEGLVPSEDWYDRRMSPGKNTWHRSCKIQMPSNTTISLSETLRSLFEIG